MPKRETAEPGADGFIEVPRNLRSDLLACHWGGCKAQARNEGGYCEPHRRKAGRRANGDDGSDHTHGRANPLSDVEIAEIRRRMSRFENPKDIARSLGITKSALFAALKRRG